MAAIKTWGEIASLPRYQSLPEDEKSAARETYFQKYVSPHISPEEQDSVYKDFLSRAARLEKPFAAKPEPIEQQPMREPATMAPPRKHGMEGFSRLFTPDIYDEEIQKSKELMRSDSSVDKLLGGLGYAMTPLKTVARGFAGEPAERVAEDIGVPEQAIPAIGAMAEIALPGIGVTNLPGTAAKLDKAARAAMTAKSMRAVDPAILMADDAIAASDEIVGGLTQNKEKLMRSAQRLKVKLTPGRIKGGLRQTMEEQSGKFPGLSKPVEKATKESTESFHRALGREIGLEDSPYLTVSDIKLAKSRLSDVYKEILPQAKIVTGTAESKSLAQNAAKLTAPFSAVKKGLIKKSASDELDRIQNATFAGIRDGEISGDDLKSLGTEVREITQNKDISEPVRRRFKDFREVLEDSLAKSLDETDPALAQRLRLNNKQYANAEILEDVQSAPGSNALGYVSGPNLSNAVKRKYKDTKKAGNFGELADIGKTFFQKGPDSGTPDRMVANNLLNMATRIGTVGSAGSLGIALTNLPTTAVALGALWGLSKATAAIYFKTPTYQKALAAAKTAAKTATGVARRPAALSTGIDSVLRDASGN